MKKLILMIPLILACSPSYEPVPINEGKDKCDYCKMVIVDSRFSGEIITRKGKVYKFDDVGKCLVNFYKENRESIAKVYVVDFSTKKIFEADEMLFFRHPSLKTPMGSGVVAFKDVSDLEEFKRKLGLEGGEVLKFEELVK